jgi:transcriptional regulator with XRE-family HTH domain
VTTVAEWLRMLLEECHLTQHAAADYVGVAGATLSEIVHQGNLPRFDILFCLANHPSVRFLPDDPPPASTTSETLLRFGIVRPVGARPALRRLWIRLFASPPVRPFLVYGGEKDHVAEYLPIVRQRVSKRVSLLSTLWLRYAEAYHLSELPVRKRGQLQVLSRVWHTTARCTRH